MKPLEVQLVAFALCAFFVGTAVLSVQGHIRISRESPGDGVFHLP